MSLRRRLNQGNRSQSNTAMKAVPRILTVVLFHIPIQADLRYAPSINRCVHQNPFGVHKLRFYRSTRRISYGHHMDQQMNSRTAFDVTLADGTSERVSGANAYQQEQSMTTFFHSSSDRQSFDCWSIRVASFRTDSIMSIRRVQSSHANAEPCRHRLAATV